MATDETLTHLVTRYVVRVLLFFLFCAAYLTILTYCQYAIVSIDRKIQIRTFFIVFQISRPTYGKFKIRRRD